MGWGSVEVAEEFLSTELSPHHPRLWRMVVEVRNLSTLNPFAFPWCRLRTKSSFSHLFPKLERLGELLGKLGSASPFAHLPSWFPWESWLRMIRV